MVTLFAFTFMLFDHFRIAFCPDNIFLLAVGRLAFPLFAWGITRGYKVTKSFYKYSLRLLILAVVSQLPFELFLRSGHFNVCFTLLAGLVALKLIDSKVSILLKWPLIILLSLVSQFAGFEYGIYGILTIVIFYVFGDRYINIVLQGVLTLAYIIAFSINPVQIVAALSPILIYFLRDYDFKVNRAIRYGFYPVHLTLLYVLKDIIV